MPHWPRTYRVPVLSGYGPEGAVEADSTPRRVAAALPVRPLIGMSGRSHRSEAMSRATRRPVTCATKTSRNCSFVGQSGSRPRSIDAARWRACGRDLLCRATGAGNLRAVIMAGRGFAVRVQSMAHLLGSARVRRPSRTWTVGRRADHFRLLAGLDRPCVGGVGTGDLSWMQCWSSCGRGTAWWCGGCRAGPAGAESAGPHDVPLSPQDDSWSRTRSNNRSSKTGRPAVVSGGCSRTARAGSQASRCERGQRRGPALELE